MFGLLRHQLSSKWRLLESAGALPARASNNTGKSTKSANHTLKPPSAASYLRRPMQSFCLLLLLLLLARQTGAAAPPQLMPLPASTVPMSMLAMGQVAPGMQTSTAGYGMRIVPGSTTPEAPVTQVVMPNDEFATRLPAGNLSLEALRTSNIIDHKRYVEAVSSRCLVSTVLEDPVAVEPSFVIVRPSSEVRLNATAPADQIRQVAHFEPALPTTILVHGFTQSYPDTTWLRKSRALFEKNSVLKRYNLVIMDWRAGATGSYGQVAARVSGMGSFLANFIMKLLELGADRMQIHVVGHSLGAHVSGFAGKRIRPRIGRITALDAAGPCFGKIVFNGPSDRLSADDAFQVAAYHYDDDFLGLPGQQAQFDIYVNGGSQQPGCKGNVNTVVNFLVTTIFRLNRALSESHTRSTEVSTVQLAHTGCQHVAYECADYAAFSRGECATCDHQNSQCYLMSLHYQLANQPELPLRTSFPGKRMYISTGPQESSLCMLHYQILVKLEPLPDFKGDTPSLANKPNNKIRLQVELTDERLDRFSLQMSNQVAPNVFTYLLLTELAPTRFRAASVQVRDSSGKPLEPLSGKLPLRFQSIEVNYMSNIDPQVRRTMSSRLCPVELPAEMITGHHSSTQNNSLPQAEQPGNSDVEWWWTRFEECFHGPPTSTIQYLSHPNPPLGPLQLHR